MFYSENLLSKEGPLAQVWLAANLERKLSKNQFLQSNIIQSTKAIENATSQNEDSEALALRLSGQLLYGVVRIYSRKAKYLLDDVSDALLKLKSAFKSSSNTVTLPVNATIVPSVNQLILQDTITQSDLLYQEPLTFDDNENPRHSDFFGQSQAVTNQDFDDSIELPRNKFDELDDLEAGQDDLDFDLNFDLDEDRVEKSQQNEEEVQGNQDFDFDFGNSHEHEHDQSIEIGRAGDEANLSHMDQEGNDDIDLGFDLDQDLQQPLEVIPGSPEVIEGQEEPRTPTKRPRRARTTVAGHRKIVEDSQIEIPIRNFNDTNGIVDSDEENTTELDLKSKRNFIEALLRENYIQDDIAESLLCTKRQKISSPVPEDEAPELEHSEEEANKTNEPNEMDMEFDFGGGDIDFGFDDQRVPMEEEQAQGGEEIEQEQVSKEEETLDDFNSGSNNGISESTIKVSSELRGMFEDKESLTFSEIVKKDAESEAPLSKLPKNEATRVFFELLVLGTSDSVELKQKELFGEIQVESRQNLFQKFL